MNVLTRSGTNQLHGSLFENFQADNLNAGTPFLTFKPPYTYNQYGGSSGGAIRKDKIFLFGAYEGYQQAQAFRHRPRATKLSKPSHPMPVRFPTSGCPISRPARLR